MSAVTLYRAQDGSLFETESEQQAYDAQCQHKEAIESFIDRHFPIPAPEAVLNDDGTPKLDENGKPVTKAKQNAGRGPARKAVSLWLAEHQA